MTIVESHHHVLKSWAYYRSTLDVAPRLLTLDHHTDTSAPFRTYFRKNGISDSIKISERRSEFIKNIDFTNSSTVESAIERLDHDEHIMTAISADIIQSAFVIAHNAIETDINTYDKHKVMCSGVAESSSSRVSAEDCNQVLETSFLSQKVDRFNRLLQQKQELKLFERPFILDIDLDYLNTYKSVKPTCAKFIKDLVRQAGHVTIAIESEHVQLCALDKELNSTYLLEELLSLIGDS